MQKPKHEPIDLTHVFYNLLSTHSKQELKNPSSELHLSFRSFDLKARSLYHFKIWYSAILEKYLTGDLYVI